jgi:hypothetical protein
MTASQRPSAPDSGFRLCARSQSHRAKLPSLARENRAPRRSPPPYLHRYINGAAARLRRAAVLEKMFSSERYGATRHDAEMPSDFRNDIFSKGTIILPQSGHIPSGGALPVPPKSKLFRLVLFGFVWIGLDLLGKNSPPSCICGPLESASAHLIGLASRLG